MNFIIALFWGALAIWRIRLLARFFQLEEYKSGRFLNWLKARREWLAPQRLIIGAGVGILASIVLLGLNVEQSLIYLLLWLAVGIFIVWPEPVKEVKKRFVATQRAKRLIATAFALALLLNLGATLFINSRNHTDDAQKLVYIAIIGLIFYAFAPLALPIANALMFPVEASLRRGFQMKAMRRLKQANPTVIGITGSYGKTSTKEYVTHILQGRFKVLATPKSFNTVMGICITINKDLDPHAGYQYFVVEMGAYVRGEIKRICQLTQPQIAIVTAVGPQHLERFGSVENIVAAKYEIIKGLPTDGMAVFNWDDPNVQSMYERDYPKTRYAVSVAPDPASPPRLIAQNIEHSTAGLSFDVLDRETNEQRRFNTSLVGLHNVTNILLATMVARHLGMPLNEIALRVTSLAPAEHRLRQNTLPNGITLLDDAYNTNPVGAANALEVLGLYKTGRRVLVTPGMVELGPLQDSENEKLGQVAAQHCTDIVLVGATQTKPIQRGVQSTNFDPAHLYIFDTVQEAIGWYQRELKSGDAILFLNDLSDNYL